MLKEFLESSRKYKTRLKELRIQALTLCIYNLLIAHFVIHQEELIWNYGLVGGVYREKIGIKTTVPIISSKFGFTYGYLNVVFSIIMSFPIFIPTRKIRNYLLPGLFWNIYFLTSHTNNIIETCYDIVTLAPGAWTSLMIITAAIFLISIHIMLLLDTISYYDLLNMKTPQMEAVTLDEIEESFEFTQNPWLLIENEYLKRGFNIYKNNVFLSSLDDEEEVAENYDDPASGDSSDRNPSSYNFR